MPEVQGCWRDADKSILKGCAGWSNAEKAAVSMIWYYTEGALCARAGSLY